jgi:hypothetical protein
VQSFRGYICIKGADGGDEQYHHGKSAFRREGVVRKLFVTDLVQLTMAPSAAPALKQLAEELVLARLPQLPSAQKMVLARRGSAVLPEGC